MDKWFDEKADYIIKQLVKVLLIVLLFSLASKWLFNMFDEYIVQKCISVLYKEKLNLFETLLTSILSFYILYLLVVKYSHTIYKLRFFTIFLMFFVTGIYFFCRYNNSFIYTRIFTVNSYNGIAFLDIPFFLMLTMISVFFVNRLNSEQTKVENDLILDIPLDLIENDEYDRKEVYEGLLNQISKINFQEKKSFCLGIVNSWGEGKTSFLNFLEKRLLTDSNTIVVKFNPWLSINSDNLTLDFFQTFNSELSKYIYTGSDFRKYANNLTAINSVFNPFKYLPNSWIGDKPHQNSFDDINELIKKSGKRFFVFIDDLDRLDNKEVFNLLRTIRNTANFGNVHFVVPFDKSYVINAIDQNKIYKPEHYIKKIFDVEIVLPPISKDRLQEIFYKLFIDLFSNKIVVKEEQKINFETQLKAIVYDTGYITAQRAKYSKVNPILFKWLKNKRDIIRFFNASALAIQNNHEWLYLPDLLILELIKFYGSRTYGLLYENDYFLNTENDGNGRQYYKLKDEGDKGKGDFMKSILYNRIGSYDIATQIDDDDLKILIEELFQLPVEKDFMAEYALVYKSNFNNYFQYRENGIRFNEIEDLINGK